MAKSKYYESVFFSTLAEPKWTPRIAPLLRTGYYSEWASQPSWSYVSQLEMFLFLFSLFSAADLEQGLDRPRLGQIGQAKIFRNWADDTMRMLEVRVT